MNILREKITKPLKGRITIPPDKSICHRAGMLSLLVKGKIKISNYSKGADCLSTFDIIQKLGCNTEFIDEKTLIIDSKNALQPPKTELSCNNSGTTMRLMSGILAGQNFNSVLTGDESLSKRPMKRVIEPLSLMGAKIEHKDFKAPLKIFGKKLTAIDYTSKLASAQVKSCILLAGLNADGVTTYREPYRSRNHTELMLDYLGADISVNENTIKVSKSELVPRDILVCGDISSAAFFIAAACLVPGSDIIIENIGLNPTRTGILEVLEKMGADIEILNKKTECNEESGDLRIKHAELKGVEISGEIIPRLIDELPVIAVLATQAQGTTTVKDAGDLRNKESDRISCLVKELAKTGIKITETGDGFIITGKQKIKGGAQTDCHHDHRLAMSLYVAGLIAEQPVKIDEFQWVNISFPEFSELMAKIGA